MCEMFYNLFNEYLGDKLKFVFSSDVILCGWLGSKHQLTTRIISLHWRYNVWGAERSNLLGSGTLCLFLSDVSIALWYSSLVCLLLLKERRKNRKKERKEEKKWQWRLNSYMNWIGPRGNTESFLIVDRHWHCITVVRFLIFLELAAFRDSKWCLANKTRADTYSYRFIVLQ